MKVTNRGEFLDVLVGRTEGGEPDDLGKLGEGRVGEERHVTQDLVTDVRLGRVKRTAAVSDVLGAVEDPECQSGQEVPGRQQSGHRPEREARAVCEPKRIIRITPEMLLLVFPARARTPGACG